MNKHSTSSHLTYGTQPRVVVIIRTFINLFKSDLVFSKINNRVMK